MSPPGGPAGAAGFSSGISATSASVVSNRLAMLAPFSMATLATFAGSVTPGLDHILVVFGEGVEAEVGLLARGDLLGDNGSLVASVVGDLPHGLLEGASDDVRSRRLIALQLESVEGTDAAHVGDAAARYDTFLDRGASRLKGVLDAGLLFFHLRFGGGADIDDGDAAGQFGEPLLQFFTVVIGGCLVDLGANLLNPAFDVSLLARAFDNGRVVFVDGNAFGLAEVVEGRVLDLQPSIFGDDPSTGQHGEVFEHRLAAVTKAGRLHGGDFQGAAQLVDDEGGKGFALDVLGDDEQRFAELGDLLEDGNENPACWRFSCRE